MAIILCPERIFQVRQLTSIKTESQRCRIRVKGSSYRSIEVMTALTKPDSSIVDKCGDNLIVVSSVGQAINRGIDWCRVNDRKQPSIKI